VYYEKPGVKKMKTCTMLFYDDSRDMWRLDSSGLVLREKWSKYYPRIKEVWTVNK
jgi:predicted RNA-binding Zn ribbon-like protein